MKRLHHRFVQYRELMSHLLERGGRALDLDLTPASTGRPKSG